MSDVTRLLDAAAAGDTRAASELLPLVYDELRKLAAARMARESPGQTLEATALVHEAYLRLLGGAEPHWNSRAHFFAAAAEAMRRILLDHARAKGVAKRGGGAARAPLSVVDLAVDSDPAEILALDTALERLEQAEPEVASVVRLRVFAGLSGDDTAQALGISPRQVDRLWAYARAWLAREVAE